MAPAAAGHSQQLVGQVESYAACWSAAPPHRRHLPPSPHAPAPSRESVAVAAAAACATVLLLKPLRAGRAAPGRQTRKGSKRLDCNDQAMQSSCTRAYALMHQSPASRRCRRCRRRCRHPLATPRPGTPAADAAAAHWPSRSHRPRCVAAGWQGVAGGGAGLWCGGVAPMRGAASAPQNLRAHLVVGQPRCSAGPLLQGPGGPP